MKATDFSIKKVNEKSYDVTLKTTTVRFQVEGVKEGLDYSILGWVGIYSDDATGNTMLVFPTNMGDLDPDKRRVYAYKFMIRAHQLIARKLNMALHFFSTTKPLVEVADKQLSFEIFDVGTDGKKHSWGAGHCRDMVAGLNTKLKVLKYILTSGDFQMGNKTPVSLHPLTTKAFIDYYTVTSK